jgi:hypothetical protein
VKFDEVLIRALTAAIYRPLAAFRCSDGEPFEDVVEQQIRDSLPLRYLASPPRFDGRMLIGAGPDGQRLVVGAHHIEPTLVPDVGYTEVIAVASEARGTLVRLPQGREISLGELMLYAIFKQMIALRRHQRTFVRVDRRNARSLALCDRVGLLEERPDQDAGLIQRWGELPRHEWLPGSSR